MSKKNKQLLHNAFPAAYIESGLNGSKAYKAIKVHAKDTTARTEASKLLATPNIQERIKAMLPSEEVEGRVITQAITAEIKEDMTWKDKHKYLETSLKLKGLLKTANDKPSVQVGIIIDRK